jgi:hypothetical protein
MMRVPPFNRACGTMTTIVSAFADALIRQPSLEVDELHIEAMSESLHMFFEQHIRHCTRCNISLAIHLQPELAGSACTAQPYCMLQVGHTGPCMPNLFPRAVRK